MRSVAKQSVRVLHLKYHQVIN